jgi:hypothetical protein
LDLSDSGGNCSPVCRENVFGGFFTDGLVAAGIDNKLASGDRPRTTSRQTTGHRANVGKIMSQDNRVVQRQHRSDKFWNVATGQELLPVVCPKICRTRPIAG